MRWLQCRNWREQKNAPNSKYLAIAFRPPLVAASFISSFDVCSRASSTLRPTDLAGITVAKWLCGTSDRHIAPRVPGSNAHLWRAAPATNSFRLCGVLQSSAHALGITERCALASSSPTVWWRCRDSYLGRATSSIRPDIIFGKDTGSDGSRLDQRHLRHGAVLAAVDFQLRPRRGAAFGLGPRGDRQLFRLRRDRPVEIFEVELVVAVLVLGHDHPHVTAGLQVARTAPRRRAAS